MARCTTLAQDEKAILENMKNYKVACQWRMYGDMIIEADNVEQAIEKVGALLSSDDLLPSNGEYVRRSIAVLTDETIKRSIEYEQHVAQWLDIRET